MARGKALRHITKEQFSEGTTIDGARLDRAMEDFERHFNRVPRESVQARLMQQQYVWGWQPQVAAVNTAMQQRFPFLRMVNDSSQWFDSPSPTSKNKFRAKGTKVPGIQEKLAVGTDVHTQWLWQTHFRASKPMLLHDLTAMLLSDQCFGMPTDGVNQAIENLGGHTTPVTNAGFSFFAWVKTTSTATTSRFGSVFLSAANYAHFGILKVGPNFFYDWEINSPSSGLITATSAITELNNQWVHMGFVIRNTATAGIGVFDCYLDGVLVGTSGANDFTGVSHDSVRFGANHIPADFAAMDIRDAAFWGRGLTTTEVRRLAKGDRNLLQSALDYGGGPDLLGWWTFGDDPADTNVLVNDQAGTADLTVINGPINAGRCGIYENDFEYGALAPFPAKNGAPSDDWSLQIAISDDTDPEFRRADLVELNKWQASARSWRMMSEALSAPPRSKWLDMEPPHPGAHIEGLFVRFKDLNIPVPAGARVRVGLAIPDWNPIASGGQPNPVQAGWNTNNTYGGANPNRSLATQNQAYNITLTALEELDEGGAPAVLRKSRQRLARGTWLHPEHIFDNTTIADNATLGELVDNLNFVGGVPKGVDSSQLVHNLSPFRINLNVPFIDGILIPRMGTQRNDFSIPEVPYTIPLQLPPLQEHFDANGVIDQNTPFVILDEIQLSWDQRAESAQITSSYDAVADPYPLMPPATSNEGKLKKAVADRLTVKLRLYEKPITRNMPDVLGVDAAIDPTRQSMLATTQIASFEIDATSVLNDKEKVGNPFVLSDIGVTLNPYNSYTIGIFADGLDNPSNDDRMALVNLQIGLRCHYELVAKDVAGSNVQNIPTKHVGVNSGAGLTAIVAPVAGAEIQAEGAQGISEQMSNIDAHMQKGLLGGYTWWGDEHPRGADLAEDSGYEVIAVPMFGCLPKGVSNQITKELVPYIADNPAAVGRSPMVDRRLIPLAYPVTVHHVIAAVNYQSWSQTFTTFIDGHLTHQIGVGVMCGPAADKTAYQQVAYLEALQELGSGPWLTTHLVDRILNPADLTESAAWDLINVPLVERSGFPGVGYAAQGKPFFCAPGLTPTFPRSNVGQPASAVDVPSRTEGSEQYLEVRWSIHPDTTWGNIPDGNETVFVGYGGNWVYLICKKHLV